MRPISIYCHFPWCIEKCPYCDFNSHRLRPRDSFSAYTAALCQDLRYSRKHLSSHRIVSVFLGGGTPSLFHASRINQVLDSIHTLFHVDPALEVTLEMNPNSRFEGANPLRWYRQAGVNRLSIGAQSFNNQHLKRLGRTHQAHCIIQTFNEAREHGFTNINIDLMYALPKQTLNEALHDLEIACSLQPEHLSWYQLTLEPNTVFHQQPPSLPSDDLAASMMDSGLNYLASRGYTRYEISAFSLSGMHCRHNSHYWTFGDYLGCGAGAHSKLSRPQPLRYERHRSPKAYLLAPTKDCHRRTLHSTDLAFEYMLNRTRLLTYAYLLLSFCIFVKITLIV